MQADGEDIISDYTKEDYKTMYLTMSINLLGRQVTIDNQWLRVVCQNNEKTCLGAGPFIIVIGN